MHSSLAPTKDYRSQMQESVWQCYWSSETYIYMQHVVSCDNVSVVVVVVSVFKWALWVKHRQRWEYYGINTCGYIWSVLNHVILWDDLWWVDQTLIQDKQNKLSVVKGGKCGSACDVGYVDFSIKQEVIMLFSLTLKANMLPGIATYV